MASLSPHDDTPPGTVRSQGAPSVTEPPARALPHISARPPASPARHPWKGLPRLVAFFALIAILAFGLSKAIDHGLRRIKTSGLGNYDDIVTGRINADIVISGSSRAMVHYDPRIIERITGRTAFNIGVNGSQTDMQLAVLKTYLKHNAKPALIIHNLDLYSFETSHEIFNPAQYVPYLGEEAIYNGIRRVYPDVWKWRYLPLYGYIVEDMRFTWLLGLRALLSGQAKEDPFRGFVPRYIPWTGDFDGFRRENPKGVRFSIEAAGLSYIEELGEIARKEGVPVLFVYSPEYFEMQALEQNRDEILTRFREIGERFDIPLWDYSNSPLTRTRENFYNSQHLNATGAEAFSIDLSRRLTNSTLLAPMARQARPRSPQLSRDHPVEKSR